jgi:tetratricopeptide (TPR) repeat protein
MIMKHKLWLVIVCGILLWTVVPDETAAAAGSDANAVKGHLAEAQKLSKENKYEEALKFLEKALTIEPNNETVLVQEERMFLELNRPDDAMKVCDKLISLEPNDPNRLMRKAFMAAESGRWEEALKVSDKLIQIQPDVVTHYIGRGQCLAALKRNDEALKALDKATTLDPNSGDAWNIKGAMQAELKQYDAAIASCTKAIEVSSPKLTGFRVYSRACVYAQKGDKSSALADIKRAIELQPNFKEQARKDENFEALQSDPDFKKLTD